jgi:hypothetical protein
MGRIMERGCWVCLGEIGWCVRDESICCALSFVAGDKKAYPRG